MIKLMKFLKEYWIQITAIVAGISAAAIFPYRLGNAEQEIQDLKEQTTAIYKWVEQEQQAKQHEKELNDKAPAGYRWDPVRREYVRNGR